MSSGFWAGGPDAYEKGLRQHFHEQLAALRERLRQCTTDAQREEVGKEIQATEQLFRNKVKEIDQLIF